MEKDSLLDAPADRTEVFPADAIQGSARKQSVGSHGNWWLVSHFKSKPSMAGFLLQEKNPKCWSTILWLMIKQNYAYEYSYWCVQSIYETSGHWMLYYICLCIHYHNPLFESTFFKNRVWTNPIHHGDIKKILGNRLLSILFSVTWLQFPPVSTIWSLTKSYTISCKCFFYAGSCRFFCK